MPPPIEDGLVISGYQKKLKTMKKKYFVLYKGTVTREARLEYFDNEKKFKSGLAPKKVIMLKHCFSINRRLDTKHEFVIALSTKEGGFGIVMCNEEQMRQWLEVLISLQRDSHQSPDVSQTHFEHVWQVVMQRKGVAVDKGIVGNYHVCLTAKSITLIKIGTNRTLSGDKRASPVEFLLTSIRRCGDSQCVFYIEVGRQSIVGPGELWMETEDALTAQNMHQMILSAMSNKVESGVIEPMRKRSSSANEASKPINILQRKKPDLEKPNSSPQKSAQFIGLYSTRERCDSLPTRNRGSNELSNQSFSSSVLDPRKNLGMRPYSYQRFSSSPPASINIGCSESEESSFDESDENGSFVPYRLKSRSSKGVIFEENLDDISFTAIKEGECEKTNFNDKTLEPTENYMPMAPLKISADDTQSVTTSSHVSTTDSNFTESKPESAFKTTCDCDIQERPTRTYSIGSKVEFNKINKRIGSAYENDQSLERVRAYSVGSRAKIPKCDLQRGILYPTTAMRNNLSSNNNIVVNADNIHCTPLLHMNSSREKKTISAPSLIHKSHNSAEQMSDLMEIDFSKSASHEKTLTYLFNETDSLHNQSYTNCEHTNLSNRFPRRQECIVVNLSSATTNPMQTDNGYLEMKPVGNITNKPVFGNFGSNANTKANKNEDINTTKSKESKTELKVSSKLINKATTTISPILEQSQAKNYERHLGKLSLSLTNCPHFPLTSQTFNNIETNDQSSCLNSVDINRTIVDKLNDLALNTLDNKEIISLKHSKADLLIKAATQNENLENVNKNLSKNVYFPYKSGYEMLQIKSESSLQTLFTRKGSLEKEEDCKTDQITKCSNCSCFNTATICNCTSSSTSCLNNTPSNNPVKVLHPKNDESTKATLISISSRPSSVNSDQALYYAKLDLPHCTNNTCPKDKNNVFLDDNGSNAKHVVNNSYAKIDFEHSDNSSTSSKNY